MECKDRFLWYKKTLKFRNIFKKLATDDTDLTDKNGFYFSKYLFIEMKFHKKSRSVIKTKRLKICFKKSYYYLAASFSASAFILALATIANSTRRF